MWAHTEQQEELGNLLHVSSYLRAKILAFFQIRHAFVRKDTRAEELAWEYLSSRNTSMGWLLARESRLMALAYSRLRKLVHISYSGWVWSTERYSIQVAKPSLSHR